MWTLSAYPAPLCFERPCGSTWCGSHFHSVPQPETYIPFAANNLVWFLVLRGGNANRP